MNQEPSKRRNSFEKQVITAISDLLLVVKNLWRPLTLGDGFKIGVHRIKSGTGEEKKKRNRSLAKNMPVTGLHTSQHFTAYS